LLGLYSLPNIATAIKGWWLLENVARMDTIKKKTFCLQNLDRQDRLGVLDVDGRNIIVS
jgi:hypothetical protein